MSKKSSNTIKLFYLKWFSQNLNVNLVFRTNLKNKLSLKKKLYSNILNFKIILRKKNKFMIKYFCKNWKNELKWLFF